MDTNLKARDAVSLPGVARVYWCLFVVELKKGGPRQGYQRRRDTRISQHLRFPQRGTFTLWFPGTSTEKAGGRTIVFSVVENKFHNQPAALGLRS